MLRTFYLSPLGIVLSVFMHMVSQWSRFFMVYGYFNRRPFRFRKHTRISSTAILTYKSRIHLGHAWIGHYCLLDGIGGIKIGEGVHLASHTCIYTHSSHHAIRLLGPHYIRVAAQHRPAYEMKPVCIGPYTFIGTHSVILPGVSIGKGCIVGAGSVVTASVNDFEIVAGNPATVKGNTREIDADLLKTWKSDDSYYLKT